MGKRVGLFGQGGENVGIRKTSLQKKTNEPVSLRVAGGAERMGFLRNKRMQNAIILDFIDRIERLLNSRRRQTVRLQVGLNFDLSPRLIEQLVVRKSMTIAGVVEKMCIVEMGDDRIDIF